MPTLLLRLAGPMQACGTSSRFDDRDTGKEPSKSGVIGLLAAALGIDRTHWEPPSPMCEWRMGVRHDRPGVPRRDSQTAQHIIKADASGHHETAVTQRHCLADAVFLVGLEGGERTLLECAHAALANPAWPLALGRKSNVPSEAAWMPGAVVDAGLRDALLCWPRIGKPQRAQQPGRLLLSLESALSEGLMKMDQPLGPFSERRFGPRFVLSEVCDVPDAPAA